jgi:hypothetical protein
MIQFKIGLLPIEKHSSLPFSDIWIKIWKSNLWQKIRAFLWMVGFEKLSHGTTSSIDDFLGQSFVPCVINIVNLLGTF